MNNKQDSRLRGNDVLEMPAAIHVGDYEIYVFEEQMGVGNPDLLLDAPADIVAKYIPTGTYPHAINAVLVRRGKRVWMIDTGYGITIFKRMAALGIAPEDVETVFLTHTHRDHIGGLLTGEGKRAFPRAGIWLAACEYDFWKVQPNETAQKIFAAYGTDIHTFEPVALDAPVQQGITPVAAYGHTPGHTVFRIADGDNQLFVWGDLTHVMPVQMPHPEIAIRFDIDPAAAIAGRLQLLRYLADNHIPFVGMHVPSTRAQWLTASGNGYKTMEN